MKDSLDSRYALALFSLSKDENSLIETQKEIKEIKKIFKTNLEFFNLLKSEFLSFDTRFNLVDKILSDCSNMVRNFLKIIIKNHRLNKYESIFNSFNTLCNEENNIIEGIVYSTVMLSEEDIKRIEVALEKKNNIKIELINRIDNSLIGGIKVSLNNVVYDYSIQNEITSLKNKLIS